MSNRDANICGLFPAAVLLKDARDRKPERMKPA
jgi:hypothetical protein